ncbi:hypothetical protein RFI_35664 [Reticulomyxa filosa]|uniref:Uncharacterized protein n=1 Tax=Reticulomyxa filosa TaxID=46433 RepID=X6LK84_RETFI|nr:hypothetical protein RFI_35664 [Reticulomyxa filosa]|eukprot:ETO01776.1 hypothetical protein RFI_35664 [Reticulomyxa filosa]
MKSSLVLMMLHVSNAFVVISSANEMNTSNCSWTNRQKHFTQHSNTSILAISRDMLLNHLWKLETWKCEQYLQFYNNMTSAPSLQISNNESTNKIIRIFQSTLSANIKQSKKNWHSKTSTMNILISISIIQLTIYKVTLTSATFSVLKNSKVDAMLSTQRSKRTHNSQERVSIGDVGCDKSFLVQHDHKQEFNHQHYLQPLQIFFFQVSLHNPSEYQPQTFAKHNSPQNISTTALPQF